jgi:predicted dehydrogenase
LEVDVDAAADFLLGFKNGVTGHVHLNFFQKVPRREYRYEFREASVSFNFFTQELEVRQKQETNVFILENFERNDLFINQTKDFFAQIETYTEDQTIHNIQEAARVVALCEPL